MPIRPEARGLYPDNWRELSKRIRFERAQNRCEWCGAENYQLHPVTGSKVILTVAHVDHDPTNNDEANLAALCQRCHLRHDAKEHASNARRTRARKAGQLELPAGAGFRISSKQPEEATRNDV